MPEWRVHRPVTCRYSIQHGSAASADFASHRDQIYGWGTAGRAGGVDFDVYLEKDGRTVRGRQKGGASTPDLRALIRWIEQGIKNFNDTTRRAVDCSTSAESAGDRAVARAAGEYGILAAAEFTGDQTTTASLQRPRQHVAPFNAGEMASIVAWPGDAFCERTHWSAAAAGPGRAGAVSPLAEGRAALREAGILLARDPCQRLGCGSRSSPPMLTIPENGGGT